MTGRIVLHGLQHGEVLETALGRGSALAQHSTELIARSFDFVAVGADDMGAQHRRRRLAKGAGLDVLGEIGDPAALIQHHIGGDPAAAQLCDPLRRPLRRRQPAGPWHVGGQGQDAGAVEIVDHPAAACGSRAPWPRP